MAQRDPMRNLQDILQSTSDSLFPADLGRRPVHLDSRSSDGDTPLHVLLWRKDVSGARALLAAGANPDIRSEFGDSPRTMAATRNEDIARLLKRALGR